MFLLPLSISDNDALPNRIHKPEEEEDYTIPSDNESEQTSPPEPPPSFPELESQIDESIKTLGGAIFPKLNWSSPKDSAWISPNARLKMHLIQTDDEVKLLDFSPWCEFTFQRDVFIESLHRKSAEILKGFVDDILHQIEKDDLTQDGFPEKGFGEYVS
ncbi:hypothetical protein L1987_70526 [Smallanthus sonchifolius]|uniref:Uncharacterized protein n=1 Tax=Smallanthus sonchifolius TaxID=185202 RepID=A0ACB9APA1_9ASTR|nr:hypothetical protein L1987_70526 [Smallanthus sonchifolius]